MYSVPAGPQFFLVTHYGTNMWEFNSGRDREAAQIFESIDNRVIFRGLIGSQEKGQHLGVDRGQIDYSDDMMRLCKIRIYIYFIL